MRKTYLNENVCDATHERLKYIFDEFDNVLVAFSCGKDSGVLLNMCYDYAKEHNMLDKMAMYYMDYEANYKATDEYSYRSFIKNFDGIKKYWLCLPVTAQCTCSSDGYWIPWDIDKKDLWVKAMPCNQYVINTNNVPFNFVKGTYGRNTRVNFTEWFSSVYGKTVVLIGLRCDESLNRQAVITSKNRKNMYNGLRYTNKIYDNTYAFYPLYDWKAEDIWIANAKFGYDYNKVYDLMYCAGLSVREMRTASPFHACGQSSLKLFKILSPYTWQKMVCRVNGANYMSIYGGTDATGYKNVIKPENYTWYEYCLFLLNTLDTDLRKHYVQKINMKYRNNVTEIFWKQMCTCILKNDYDCKYMNLVTEKKMQEKRQHTIAKYANI